MKEVVCHISKFGNSGVLRIDPLSNGAYQHSEILRITGQLEVSFLPIDDNPQVFAEKKKRHS